MLTSRLSLYQTELVNLNKEVDYLSNIVDLSQIRSIDTYVIPSYYSGRLDLISYELYGEVRFWWLIAQYNGIIDIVEETVAGTIIEIPDLVQYSKLYNRKAVVDQNSDAVFSSREITVE